MRYLSWIFGTILFFLTLGLAVKNSDSVVLRYYLGYQWQAPLVVVLFAAFFSGAIAGIVASLGFMFKQRREIARLRREVASLAGSAVKRPITGMDMPEAP
jgi:lipopolysaccharide assembly protein A